MAVASFFIFFFGIVSIVCVSVGCKITEICAGWPLPFSAVKQLKLAVCFYFGFFILFVSENASSIQMFSLSHWSKYKSEKIERRSRRPHGCSYWERRRRFSVCVRAYLCVRACVCVYLCFSILSLDMLVEACYYCCFHQSWILLIFRFIFAALILFIWQSTWN